MKSIANDARLRTNAEAIARAAKRLNDLREAWLNPPEWTRRVPEVVPLGMATSPYPDRIEPKAGLSEADLKALQKRTLTNLYNLRPAWLNAAQEALDAAVAVAYGWADYTPAMTDDEILQRLLALNLARAEPQPVSKTSFDLATKRRERVLQGRDAMGSGAEAMARAKARLK